MCAQEVSISTLTYSCIETPIKIFITTWFGDYHILYDNIVYAIIDKINEEHNVTKYDFI
jgi:hypothetical protein